jgi:CTP synthase (UTP-ammonia lyase)
LLALMPVGPHAAAMTEPLPRPARLALVGDRSPLVQAHARVPEVLATADLAGPLPLDAYWVGTTEVAATDLGGFDGIWALPGSPYADAEGMLAAIRFARTNAVPLLATCGGFQHMLLEWAQGVCGLDVGHAEDGTGGREALIRPLACSLVGEERLVHVVPGTRAAEVLGTAPRTERYFCGYGLDPRFEDTLVAGGLVVSGRDDEGEARLAEVPGHPFYVGALFQPELSSTRAWVHPLIGAFLAAVRDRVLAPQP